MTDACLGIETLVALVDGRANPTMRVRIEEHASRCDSCRIALSSLARGATPRTTSQTSALPVDRELTRRPRFGRYVLAHEIGAGGMGVVYAARDPELDRMVAVKVLQGDSDQRLQERLRREAQAMAQLAHPNVVAVHDVGVFDDRMFIAMEYVDGETLARWITRPRSQHEILDAYCAAGRGLAAAHAAGIVHRDFKPENVLIGMDGRVRVGDFGLARPTTGSHPERGTALATGSKVTLASSHGPTAPDGLTAPGTLMGTPHYMAPELYDGKEADARSDQFSFCVALFTALHGVRPFEGDSLDALAATVRAGRVCEPRNARRVPRRIRAALRRGLAVEPTARFGSLHELCAELSQPSRRGRWWIGLGAALAVLAWLVARSPTDVPDQRCTGAAAAFATAWNAGRRGAIEAAFTASRVPYGAAARKAVTGSLDRYAAHWAQAHTEACRATRILGEQTEATLDLRMRCLERRRQEAAALVGALAAADAEVVARSVTAAAGLTDVGACADLATLRQIVPPPADAATRRKLAELAPRLAEASAIYETGKLARALERVRPIVAEARTLAYRPFEAEAELLQGQIEDAVADWTHAETTLDAAVWSAEAGRHDEIAARAWLRLVYVIGYGKAEYARGLALVPRATAAIERLGGNAEIEAIFERTLAAIDGAQGRFDAAIAHHEKAVAIAQRAFGPEDSNVVLPLLSLGIDLLNQGHADRAAPVLQRGTEILDRTLGPDHPLTARALSMLANAHNDAGHPALAEQELRRVLAIREASLGPQHPDLAYSRIYLGEALDDHGKSEEAVAVDRRAVAIAETAFGPQHPTFAGMLLDLGRHLGHLGRYAEADDQMRRAEAILTRVYEHDPENMQIMLVLVARGDLSIRQSRWREALALYARAIPVLETTQLTRKELTRAVTHRAEAFIELHQPERALAPLEQLADKVDDVRPDLRVGVELTLARALWDSGGDRQRARELATHALAGVKQIAGATPDDLARIERWLANHRVGG